MISCIANISKRTDAWFLMLGELFTVASSLTFLHGAVICSTVNIHIFYFQCLVSCCNIMQLTDKGTSVSFFPQS